VAGNEARTMGTRIFEMQKRDGREPFKERGRQKDPTRFSRSADGREKKGGPEIGGNNELTSPHERTISRSEVGGDGGEDELC
jgi:hypothetical protein